MEIEHQQEPRRAFEPTGMYSSGREKLWGLLNMAAKGTHTMVPAGMKCGPRNVSLVVILLVPSAVTGYIRMASCTPEVLVCSLAIPLILCRMTCPTFEQQEGFLPRHFATRQATACHTWFVRVIAPVP